ncbi:hypothetical protein D0869_10402 [Hortaea werneckii]|uniref:Uncharacterized protein n=1 Tax=Hortaea werneckii TaxID=91943 RepID=A0A3M6WE02_HORWE|nr:hypothetical protein D0869_10402 [Hortaea werneckii]RMX86673.1 hypothetical protein D0868_15111 [Hortaea werneckii]
MPSVCLHKEQYHDAANYKQEKELSEEDKKILKEAHENKDNPDHPAHKDHPKHHEFLKSIPQRLGGAAIFGAGATAGADLVSSVIH